MRKPICRTDESLRRLEIIVAKLKAEGKVFLPAERPLSEMVGTSRMTLRKAVEDLERRGLLETGSRGRVISANAVPESRGRIVFVAGGRDWIVLPAWNRLWTRFEGMARALGYSCKLKLYGHDTDTFCEQDLKNADFVVYSPIGSSSYETGLGEFAKRNPGKVIGVQKDEAAFLTHVVALDNIEGGAMAAQILVDAGYRKPLMLRQENGYFGFREREEGFKARLAKLLPGYSPRCIVLTYGSFIEYVRRLIETLDELQRSDTLDSIFLATDELVNLTYHPFASTRRIPEDFGIVALSGSHEALMHQPPVTAIGHASTNVAMEVLSLIGRLQDGLKDPAEPTLTLVKPEIHPGSTVRTPSGSVA